jgi:hypothetical protein
MANHPTRNLKSYVSTITTDSAGNLVFSPVTEYPRAKAFAAAKKLAGRNAQFTANYGPDSCAYVGEEVTAVIVHAR